MMANLCMNLAAAAVGYMWGYAAASPSEAFRQTSLAWYKRKRAVWVEVLPVDGVWTVTDVLPENPSPGAYSRYHRVEIDLSWFGVLPDSAWRVRGEQDRASMKAWRYMCDSLRRALAQALDAHPASTVTELSDILATRDLSPWTEEVPPEEGHYLVAHASRDKPEATPEVELWRFYRDHSRGLATSIKWSELWPGQRVAFRRVHLDSRVWTYPSWSEARHRRQLDELSAARDAAQAAFAGVMAEEEALRARFVAARTRRDEAFEAWQDELLKDPPESE